MPRSPPVHPRRGIVEVGARLPKFWKLRKSEFSQELLACPVQYLMSSYLFNFEGIPLSESPPLRADAVQLQYQQREYLAHALG